MQRLLIAIKVERAKIAVETAEIRLAKKAAKTTHSFEIQQIETSSAKRTLQSKYEILKNKLWRTEIEVETENMKHKTKKTARDQNPSN